MKDTFLTKPLKQIGRIFTLFTLFIYLSSGVAAQTNIYQQLDSPFYDPNSQQTTTSCTTTLVGSTNAEQSWNYFKSKGLSDAQTAGILGNFREESGINPRRVQNTQTPSGDSDINPLDGKTGYGIAQWTSLGRQQGLSKLAQNPEKPRPVSSLDLQLDFTYQEMTDSSPNDVLDGLKKITGNDGAAVEAAARYFHESFERSADKEAGINQRVLAAIRYNNLYSGTTTVTDPTPDVPICDAGSAKACTTGTILGWQLEEPCKMVSYDQGDPRWADKPYGVGKTSIAESGCGPTSLAMIGATLLNNPDITPLTVATKYGDRYHVADGSSWGLFQTYATDTGLGFKDLGADLNAAAEILRNGGFVLMSVDEGYFTSGGHLVVLRAVSQDGTGFYLADSNGKGKNGDSETRGFSSEFLMTTGQMKHLWGFTR